MNDHPFSEARFRQANDHLSQLIPIFKNGNLDAFIEIVEKEALSLHAMMMTSSPYYILMKPATLQIIERIWEFRKSENEPVCFTLDAGANVHVLYPEERLGRVYDFIQEALLPFCQEGQHITDRVGEGTKRL